MSDDLISRSALLKEILKEKTFLQKGLGKDAEYAYMSADFVIHKLNIQPTIYDADKVVEEIREYADNVTELGGNFLPEVVIEIVKSGGAAQMIRIENDCCNCSVPAYPCLGDGCPLRHQKHYYCDNCHEEVDKLYRLDDGEYCEQCVLERLEVVE